MSPLRLSRAAPVIGALLLGACSEMSRIPTAPSPAPGDPRFTASVYAGQIVINEVMADPSAVLDADGEWLEVHNRGESAVSIQGWTIAGNNDSPHLIAGAVSVPGRGFVVLARNGSAGANGGVSAGYAYGAMNMANAGDWVALRDGGGASVDSVSWGTAMPAGSSRGVTDPDAENLDAKGAGWHTSALVYGSGDDGSPGAQNEGRRSPLVVRVLEVGQGDAIYITNGLSKVLVDGGPAQSGMASLISEFGLAHGRLDLMILTHAHSDHLAGLREFFKTAQDVDVIVFMENKNAATGVTIAALRDSANARAGRGELDYRDTDDACGTGAAVCTILLDGGARVHVLDPKPTDGNENNRSVAVKVVGPDSASFTMWLAGDAEHGAIDFFDVTAGYDASLGMDVDVLKAGHHGSCNGMSSRLLDLLSPSYVTMGVSSTNTYGHVHTQTKDLLAGRSIPWYRTDENGRVTFTTPGTVGGGYSVGYARGSASMDGDGDVTSPQLECVTL